MSGKNLERPILWPQPGWSVGYILLGAMPESKGCVLKWDAKNVRRWPGQVNDLKLNLISSAVRDRVQLKIL